MKSSGNSIDIFGFTDTDWLSPNLSSSAEGPSRRVRSSTTIHLTGLVDHDDAEISQLGMKLTEQLEESQTILKYLDDEKGHQNNLTCSNKSKSVFMV